MHHKKQRPLETLVQASRITQTIFFMPVPSGVARYRYFYIVHVSGDVMAARTLGIETVMLMLRRVHRLDRRTGRFVHTRRLHEQFRLAGFGIAYSRHALRATRTASRRQIAPVWHARLARCAREWSLSDSLGQTEISETEQKSV